MEAYIYRFGTSETVVTKYTASGNILRWGRVNTVVFAGDGLVWND